jgi:hypothetical protein
MRRSTGKIAWRDFSHRQIEYYSSDEPFLGTMYDRDVRCCALKLCRCLIMKACRARIALLTCCWHSKTRIFGNVRTANANHSVCTRSWLLQRIYKHSSNRPRRWTRTVYTYVMYFEREKIINTNNIIIRRKKNGKCSTRVRVYRLVCT